VELVFFVSTARPPPAEEKPICNKISNTFEAVSEYKSGFIAIIGKPNAGKSTLLNALLGEKLAITSPKVQTTRHKIIGILSDDNSQMVFADTPGILEAKYKMQERMLEEIKAVRKDTDVLLFVMDAADNLNENIELLLEYRTKKPVIFILNKIDKLGNEDLDAMKGEIEGRIKPQAVIYMCALEGLNIEGLKEEIKSSLPVHPPYYDPENLSDRPVRFFVEEMIREKIFKHLDKEIPYHSTVHLRDYTKKKTLTKIVADIVVTRETQKHIMVGKGGSMIRKINEEARADIEAFIQDKVFLELFVKVRKDWRDNDLFLKEYGY
jgi:GTPase